MNNTVKAIILAVFLQIAFTLIFYFGIFQRNQLVLDWISAIVVSLPISAVLSFIFYFALETYNRRNMLVNDNLF